MGWINIMLANQTDFKNGHFCLLDLITVDQLQAEELGGKKSVLASGTRPCLCPQPSWEVCLKYQTVNSPEAFSHWQN